MILVDWYETAFIRLTQSLFVVGDSIEIWRYSHVRRARIMTVRNDIWKILKDNYEKQ